MKTFLLFILCASLLACGRTTSAPPIERQSKPLPSKLTTADRVFLEQAEILSHYPSTVEKATFDDQLEKVWAAWDLVCAEIHGLEGKEEFTLAMQEWNQIQFEWGTPQAASMQHRLAQAAMRFEMGRKIATEK